MLAVRNITISALLLLANLPVAVIGFLPLHPFEHRGLRNDPSLAAKKHHDESFRVVVVGKIILDEYGDPRARNDDGVDATIGGGGPQAAWGACAGLAVRDLLAREGGARNRELVHAENGAASPPKQGVAFLAPIGLKNWTPERTNALNSLLPMLETPPMLVTSDEHITPTINIWHDENETVNWKPVNGSFDEEGADGLWRNRPCAQDILDSIKGYDGDVILHAILETGDSPAGKGLDALPFFDSTLMNRVSSVGIEPIVFPDEATGFVSHEDTVGVTSLIRRVEASLSASCEARRDDKLLVISPDRPCYDAFLSDGDFAGGSANSPAEFAVRDGVNGSFVRGAIMPPAALRTPNGAPVNPTGAGNAFSGAYVACRASGSSAEEAAILANAVGAAVCEHENLPPWTWAVLERIAEAACEVRVNYDQRQK